MDQFGNFLDLERHVAEVKVLAGHREGMWGGRTEGVEAERDDEEGCVDAQHCGEGEEDHVLGKDECPSNLEELGGYPGVCDGAHDSPGRAAARCAA
jgi:hypothetical protein